MNKCPVSQRIMNLILLISLRAQYHPRKTQCNQTNMQLNCNCNTQFWVWRPLIERWFEYNCFGPQAGPWFQLYVIYNLLKVRIAFSATHTTFHIWLLSVFPTLWPCSIRWMKGVYGKTTSMDIHLYGHIQMT